MVRKVTFKTDSLFYPSQKELFFRDTRYIFLYVSRRSGKSWCCLTMAAIWAMKNQHTMKPVYFISPTHSFGEIQYKIFCKRFPDLIVYKNETKLMLRVLPGTEIHFKSAERPDLLRSNGLCGVIIDEIGFMKDDIWDAVQPMLIDIGAPAILCSTPSPMGPGHWAAEMWERMIDEPDWSCLERTAIEMGVVKLEEIEAARRTMLPDAFATEYEAKRISREGMIYKEFGEWNLVDKPAQNFIPYYYICGVDFGYDHPSVFVPIAANYAKRNFLVPEAIYHRHGNQESHVNIARELMKKYPGIVFLCDHNRPDYVEKFQECGIPASLAVKDVLRGIDDVRTMFINREGVGPKLTFFKENCKEITKEIRGYRYKDKTNMPNKQNGKDDGLDALRYGVEGFVNPQGVINVFDY